MKKINLIPKSWKIKKRQSFKLYFVLFSTIIVTISTAIPSIVYGIINEINKQIVIPELIIVSASSFLVGIILSFFVGKILLAPIKKLKTSMEEVAGGNFDIELKEGSVFDEVDDMYYYFNLMVKELKATETIQSDFISNASHEFKTPLNAIEGYATLLENENITLEEKKLYVEKILFNTSRMNQLVNNVLLLSKLDNHSIIKQNSLFLLDEQIRQSILFLEPKWLEKNIEFDIEMETIKFFGSENLMIHVWNNLISNAIKFSPKNGVIKIELKIVEDKIVFTIEDDGPGVSGEAMKHIFNKFYQADTSHKEEGYGLGLALVKKVVDLSYGEISVENVENGGARFKVLLPL